MTAISFSCVEKLPKLLDMTCCQTIRPKGKRILKVGDKVTLYWKQRSRKKYNSLNQWFCTVCGNEIDVSKFPNGSQGYCKCGAYKNINAYEDGLMSKILGTGTITEVFEIQMFQSGRFIINFINHIEESVFELATKDGFSFIEDFIKWFRKHYDLSEPKNFVVYRWRWD